MNFETIDSLRLTSDLEQLNAECMALKGVLRTTWTKPMADEQRRLITVRRKLTERYVLLTRLRGKLHVTHRPRALAPDAEWDPAAWNQRIAERLAPDYARLPVLEVAQ